MIVDRSKKLPGWAVRLTKVQMSAKSDVINPETCPECGRPWKRANAQDKSTECPECREYLDNED